MVDQNMKKDFLGIRVCQFRLHPFALSADIAKMFCQLELDNGDKYFHRILWKDPDSETIVMYRMTRVTSGIAPSSYHLIRPLRILAEETKDENLRLSMATDMYMDYLLTDSTDF